MNKTYITIFFCLFLMACSKSGGGGGQEETATPVTADESLTPAPAKPTTPKPTPPPAPKPTPKPTPKPPTPPAPTPDPFVPTAAKSWDADIYFVNFSAAQEEKVNKAVTLMKKVIASAEFKTRILNHTYNGQKTFVDNGGFTNAQIYQKIIDGAEKMGITTKNNTLNVELELYYATTSTVGYTYPDSTRIWMNTKFFNTYTPINVADNLTHEWLHKLGFGHSTSYNTARDYSVPYAIGYLMEELAAKY